MTQKATCKERSKELAIGEIGVIDGVRVECLKAPAPLIEGCLKCAFYDILCDKLDENNSCYARHRSDHTDVYFKKMEE